jgi:hypothetical protein
MRIYGVTAVVSVGLAIGGGMPHPTAAPASSGAPWFVSAPGSPFAVGKQPTAVAVGEVNGDGKADALVTNTDDDNVTVLLGDGKGGFRNAPGSPFASGPKPHLIVLGDVNGDGKLDCAVTEHDSAEVRVFLGKGDGRFERAPRSPFMAHTGKAHNHGLSFADVNRDGKPDLVTSNQEDNSVSVLLGDGKGGFAPAAGSPFPVGNSPYPHAIGDVNGDGNPDILSPNVRGNSMSVLLGDGHGGFRTAAGSPVRTPARPYHAGLGDVNGDGKLDAALSHDDVSFVSVWLGDGRGGFHPAPSSPVDLGARGSKILLRDLNRDGRLDMVVSSGFVGVIVMAGDGRGGFSRAPGPPYATGRGSWNMDVGDLNGDGKLDLVTANNEADSITVLLGR